MFYYSIESKEKVVHYEGCLHLKNIKKENLRLFDNIKEIRSSEYRICSCCSPITEYLKKEQPFKGITGKGATKLKIVLKAMDRHYQDNDDIKWNFTKFLVDREGNVVQRFEPTEDLNDVKKAIEALL